MTRRLGAFVLSLLFVALPTLNDKCDLGCDDSSHSASPAAAMPSCPLHRGANVPAAPGQPRPRPANQRNTCGHDHSTIRAVEVSSQTVLSPRVVYLYTAFTQVGLDDLVGAWSSRAALMRSRSSAHRSIPTVLRV